VEKLFLGDLSDYNSDVSTLQLKKFVITFSREEWHIIQP
jgi:hypothetical protein